MRIGGIDHLNNLKNSEMNNLVSIDFATRDWIDDTDSMIPRMAAEFPRVSDKYKNKMKANKKPWGQKSDPIYFDPYID